MTAETSVPSTALLAGADRDGSNYTARHLLVLEGLEAVRKRPGMYIGSTDSRGLMHCQIVAGILGFAIVLELGKQLEKFLRALVGEQLRGVEQTLQDIQRDSSWVGKIYCRPWWGSSLCRHGIVLVAREQERKGFCECPVVGTIG